MSQSQFQEARLRRTEQARLLLRRLLGRLAHLLSVASRAAYQSDQERRVAAWHARRGDETLRVEYDLTPASTVVDVGGFRGNWSAEIAARYACTIHIFEPVREHVAFLEKRFRGNPDVHVHPFGLAAADGTAMFSVDAERSSAVVGPPAEVVELHQADATLRGLGVRTIDLLKMNIEGGEYVLLPHLLDTGWLDSIRDLQIQWHDFLPDAQERVQALQERLRESHHLTYEFPFVWENWRRSAADEESRR